MTVAVTTPPSPPQAPVQLKAQKVCPIPTWRLYQFLILGLLIPLVVAFVGLPLWVSWGLMFLYDLGVMAIALQDNRRTAQWQIQIERSCDPRLSIGRENPIHLQLTIGAGPQPQSQLLIRDLYPPEFRASQETLEVAISPHTLTELTYHVFPPRRGAYQWSGITLRQNSPWGLMCRSWRLPLTTEIEVYPDLIGLRLLSVRLSLESSGSLRRRRHALGGTEFSELRDYNMGDDLRLLDWKATARRGRPLVRLLEPERDQPLIILLDRGRLMTAQVAGLRRFDWALNATLSLALAGLRRGDRVGVGVFDHDVHTWVGPQPGQSHLSRILSEVYNLEPVLTESDYVAVVSRVLNQHTRRALVVLLTDIVDDIASSELLAAMARLSPRFLPFCVALRDPQVDAIAHQPLATRVQRTDDQVQGLYAQSVALDLMHQRQRAFARLKQQGVMVLDAPANTISEQLVDSYLLLKARNRL
jgi:uncharacterized protein (DUF58 family)